MYVGARSGRQLGVTGCVASAFQAIAFDSLDLGLSAASIVINQVGEFVCERERESVCVNVCECV